MIQRRGRISLNFIPRTHAATTLLLTALAWITIAVAASAQAPANLKTRLTGLHAIEIPFGVTRIPNAEGDDRDAQVFRFWRDNGNAWGRNVYIVTMRPKDRSDATDWLLVDETEDSPHTGDDAILSIRFVRGTLDGKPVTLRVSAERRDWRTPIDPVPAIIRVAVLKKDDHQFAGTMPDYFEQVIEFKTPSLYTSSDEALRSELGLPLLADR